MRSIQKLSATSSRPALAAFLVWVMAAGAQQTQAPSSTPQNSRALVASQGMTTFTTTRQLVVEDVIVKDKDGNPIQGLKASDFVVTEDGKPQKIDVFHYESLETTPVEQPQQLQQRPAVVDAPGASTPKPAAPAAQPAFS